MHKTVLIPAIAVIGLSVFLIACQKQGAATAAPANVAESQKNIKTWINGLRGKTEPEILGILGKETERTTWKSGDQGGLKLKYTMGDGSLGVLFSGDRVVFVDCTIESD